MILPLLRGKERGFERSGRLRLHITRKRTQPLNSQSTKSTAERSPFAKRVLEMTVPPKKKGKPDLKRRDAVCAAPTHVCCALREQS
mmetsp:Transcript_36675/g.110115  ORF Transcript_36675/g.110115 Transcript_36675/m.110115 type:complete len:86 (-) Transcript_36675:115-372(-)